MPRFRHIQNNFTGGEISAEAHGRTDIPSYSNSCEEITNFFVKTPGGAYKRPGSQFLLSDRIQYPMVFPGAPLNGGVAFALTGKVRIIPFIFSRTDAYVIFIRINAGSAALSMANVNDLDESIAISFASNTNSAPHMTGYTTDAELEELQYAQSGDLVFFVHKNHPPFFIARTATATFELRQYYQTPNISSSGFTSMFDKGIPFKLVNTQSSITLEVIGAGTTMKSNVAFFTASMVGAAVKHNTAGGDTQATRYLYITAFTDSTTVTVTAEGGGAGTRPATDNWEFSAFGGEEGYPSSVTIFEQRLYYGKGDTTYGSEIADLFDFDAIGRIDDPGFGTVVATDPFSFTMASNEINEIQWLSGGKTLIIGTLGREYLAQGSSGALSATDISVSSETAYGSALVAPSRIENVLAFVSRDSRKIREFVFNRDQDSFIADDLTRLVNHLTIKTISLRGTTASPPSVKAIVKQETTQTILWVLDSNSGLYAMTIDRGVGTRAWHYHKLGGNLDTNLVKIQSIASLPSSDGTTEDLWLTVERTIDGSNVTYVEKITQEYILDEVFNSSFNIEDKMIYCDSATFRRKPSGVTFHYDTSEVFNASVAEGSVNGAATLLSAPSGGLLTIVDPSINKLVFNASSNLLTADKGYIRIEFQPQFTGAPSSDTTIYHSHAPSSTEHNKLKLVLKTTNVLSFEFADSSGINPGVVSTGLLGGVIFTGVSIIIELEFDFTTGLQKIWLDGVSFTAASSLTRTMDSTSSLIYIGEPGATSGEPYKIGALTIQNDLPYNGSGVAHSTEYYGGGRRVRDLEYLEGQTVTTVINGAFRGEYVVASGEITVNSSATVPEEAVIGLPYTAQIKTLPIEAGSSIGTAQTAIKRIDRSSFRFNRTIGAKFGSDEDDLETIIFIPAGLGNTAPPLFTGDKTLDFSQSPDRRGQVFVRQDLPLPMELTAIILRGITYD